uniref:Flavoprotein n=1 Tax=Eiseniibacteriota bacterium TaxID=2212470 RepID=A0A832I091_UNCEI
MSLPARNTLAIIGAGPIGLETALAALDRGFDVHVFEQGEVGSHPLAWGHVRMFTPWRMNVGPASRAHLERAGWTPPDPEALPTGRELAERLLAPLAALPELAGRVHTHAQVTHVSRRGALKGDLVGDPARREHPFRLLVRDQGGRENFLHAFAVVDASGTYHRPNRAGDGGIPARQELYLAPQMEYHIPDVLGLARAQYAGRRTLVIGGGASAATTACDLARLAAEAPGTTVAWATRAPAAALYAEAPDDPLPARRALWAEARALVAGANPAVAHIGGAVVEGFEYNSATHRYRTTLRVGEELRVEESDRVVVNTGFGPDTTITRELQVHECYASLGPMKLSAALLAAQGGLAGDCARVPAPGPETLRHPEPAFFMVGARSYARYNTFLLATGFRQAADVVAMLAAELGAAAGAR